MYLTSYFVRYASTDILHAPRSSPFSILLPVQWLEWAGGCPLLFKTQYVLVARSPAPLFAHVCPSPTTRPSCSTEHWMRDSLVRTELSQGHTSLFFQGIASPGLPRTVAIPVPGLSAVLNRQLHRARRILSPAQRPCAQSRCPLFTAHCAFPARLERDV